MGSGGRCSTGMIRVDPPFPRRTGSYCQRVGQSGKVLTNLDPRTLVGIGLNPRTSEGASSLRSNMSRWDGLRQENHDDRLASAAALLIPTDDSCLQHAGRQVPQPLPHPQEQIARRNAVATGAAGRLNRWIVNMETGKDSGSCTPHSYPRNPFEARRRYRRSRCFRFEGNRKTSAMGSG